MIAKMKRPGARGSVVKQGSVVQPDSAFEAAAKELDRLGQQTVFESLKGAVKAMDDMYEATAQVVQAPELQSRFKEGSSGQQWASRFGESVAAFGERFCSEQVEAARKRVTADMLELENFFELVKSLTRTRKERYAAESELSHYRKCNLNKRETLNQFEKLKKVLQEKTLELIRGVNELKKREENTFVRALEAVRQYQSVFLGMSNMPPAAAQGPAAKEPAAVPGPSADNQVPHGSPVDGVARTADHRAPLHPIVPTHDSRREERAPLHPQYPSQGQSDPVACPGEPASGTVTSTRNEQLNPEARFPNYGAPQPSLHRHSDPHGGPHYHQQMQHYHAPVQHYAAPVPPSSGPGTSPQYVWEYEQAYGWNSPHTGGEYERAYEQNSRHRGGAPLRGDLSQHPLLSLGRMGVSDGSIGSHGCHPGMYPSHGMASLASHPYAQVGGGAR